YGPRPAVVTPGRRGARTLSALPLAVHERPVGRAENPRVRRGRSPDRRLEPNRRFEQERRRLELRTLSARARRGSRLLVEDPRALDRPAPVRLGLLWGGDLLAEDHGTGCFRFSLVEQEIRFFLRDRLRAAGLGEGALDLRVA